MLSHFFATRHRILLSIVGFYLLPVMAISGYAQVSMPQDYAWKVLALGLLLGAGGSLTLFILMRDWEKTYEQEPVELAPEKPGETQQPPEEAAPAISQQALEEAEAKYQQAAQEILEAQKKQMSLEAQLESQKEEILNLNKEKERLQRQSDQILRDFNQFKDSSEEKFEQTRIFLGEYQQTINEQRQAIETKQQLVGQLESKVRDLTYEIKTLLQLAEMARTHEPAPAIPESEPTTEAPPPYKAEATEEIYDLSSNTDKQVNSEEEAASQLKRCIDIAQKITGANHYSSRLSRLKDLPMDNYALDLRRLFDSLRSENSATVFVYSQKENKVLFVNNQVRGLLGWSTDKFNQSFGEIIEEEAEAWKNLVSQLAYKNDSKACLLMKNKSGQSLPVNCHLGVIPTGLFRSNIIGVLYQTK